MWTSLNTLHICLRFNSKGGREHWVVWQSKNTYTTVHHYTQYCTLSTRRHPLKKSVTHIDSQSRWTALSDSSIYSGGSRLDLLLRSHHVYLYLPDPWSCSHSPSSPSCAGPWLMSPWSVIDRPTWITRRSCRSTLVCSQHTTALTGISLHLSLQSSVCIEADWMSFNIHIHMEWSDWCHKASILFIIYLFIYL